MMSSLSEKKPEFQSIIEHFRQELGALRSGRATPALVHRVSVDVYGSMIPLVGVASIGVPDTKTLTIEPWDVNLVKAVEQALIAADLGIMPTVQGRMIRLAMPMMTEDRRKQLVKVVREKLETARGALRSVREKIREAVTALEREKKISEDDRYRAQDELDKMTKGFQEELERMAEEKENEIMTV